MSINKIFLMGNLTRDPELRYTPTGAAVASFGLASNRKYKSGDTTKEEVCFVDVVVWGKAAENAAEYLAKGRRVVVEGRLVFRQWTTDEGQKKRKHEIKADNITYVDKAKDKNTSGNASGDTAGNAAGAPEDEDIGGDNIPF